MREDTAMPGVFALMLHSHIPYCRKSGVWPAGEEWLFEAMNETYIPLLKSFEVPSLRRYPSKMMIGLVPVLMEQLADAYMKERFCDVYGRQDRTCATRYRTFP